MDMGRVKAMFGTPKVPLHDTKNEEGYPAYSKDIREEYVQCLLTNTLGNTFYVDKNNLLEKAEALHDQVLRKYPEWGAKALAFARKKGYMRLQPIWGLAKLAGINKEAFLKAFNDVILIPSDLQDFMYLLQRERPGHPDPGREYKPWVTGSQGGRLVKRTVSKWLNDNLSEYWAIKYDGRGREYSLGDIIKTTHPFPKNSTINSIFNYLVTGNTMETELKQISGYELFKGLCDILSEIVKGKGSSGKEYSEISSFMRKHGTSYEEVVKKIISLIKEHKLPHEVVTGACPNMTPEIWDALVPSMPIFALIRGLNTLDRNGLLNKHRDLITQKLTNKEIIEKTKILPFRILKAFENVNEPWLKDVLRQTIELTFDNIPEVPGKTMILLDVSSSMKKDFLKIGAILGYTLFKKSDALFYLFNTQLHDSNASKYDSILTQADRVIRDFNGIRFWRTDGTATNIGIERLIGKKIIVDNIIIITDGQQNSGRSFYSALLDYRKKVNGKTKTFVIDISPYDQALTYRNDPQVYYIYGWNDKVLNFINMASYGWKSISGYIDLMA